MSVPQKSEPPGDAPGSGPRGRPQSSNPSTKVTTKPWLDDSSLGLRDRLAQAPKDGLVKGWLIHSIMENAKRQGVELAMERKYLGFKDYPVAEYLELLGQAAVRLQGNGSAKEALRELGRGVHGSFSQSLVGKVVLAGLGSGHDGARTGLRWITRVYKMTSNHATASIEEPTDHVAVISLSNVWSFPDAYHVGIFEGAAAAFGGKVSVGTSDVSLSSATLTFTWLD